MHILHIITYKRHKGPFIYDVRMGEGIRKMTLKLQMVEEGDWGEG
jgi:hypothetical protein